MQGIATASRTINQAMAGREMIQKEVIAGKVVVNITVEMAKNIIIDTAVMEKV